MTKVNEADLAELKEILDRLKQSERNEAGLSSNDKTCLWETGLQLLEEREEYMTSTYCAYCGAEYPIDTGAELVGEHIATCEKHPMRRVEQQLAQARDMVQQERTGRRETQREYLILRDERDQAQTEVERLREALLAVITLPRVIEVLAPRDSLGSVLALAEQALSHMEAQ